MSSWLDRARLAGDRLRRVQRNSTYRLPVHYRAVPCIVTANLLGVAGVAVPMGIITGFVADVNRLLSFRMNDVVVRYVGEAMARGEEGNRPRRWSRPLGWPKRSPRRQRLACWPCSPR
jgi:hypothetical protein